MKNIKLIVYDFDGVMTDNKVYLDQYGNEMVQVNRSDGLAVSEIKKLGILQLILSSEKNNVVYARAKKLGLDSLNGIIDKRKALLDYCSKQDIHIKDVAFIGNEINDLEVMKIVGVSLCPADAHFEIQNVADKIFDTNGGEGVVRDLFDLLKTDRKDILA